MIRTVRDCLLFLIITPDYFILTHWNNLNSKIESIKNNGILLKHQKVYLCIYLAIILKNMFLKYNHKNKIAKMPSKGRNDPRTMLLFFD